MSCDAIATVSWSAFSVDWTPAAGPSAADAAMGAAAPAASRACWTSQLVEACRAGRIRPQVMWDILLAYVESAAHPDVGSLLEHLPETYAKPAPVLDELLMRIDIEEPTVQSAKPAGESDDWFVMVDGHDAA